MKCAAEGELCTEPLLDSDRRCARARVHSGPCNGRGERESAGERRGSKGRAADRAREPCHRPTSEAATWRRLPGDSARPRFAARSATPVRAPAGRAPVAPTRWRAAGRPCQRCSKPNDRPIAAATTAATRRAAHSTGRRRRQAPTSTTLRSIARGAPIQRPKGTAAEGDQRQARSAAAHPPCRGGVRRHRRHDQPGDVEAVRGDERDASPSSRRGRSLTARNSNNATAARSAAATSATPTPSQPVCRRGTYQEISRGRFSAQMIRSCMNER